jgi:dihydrolipoamide dehydrogenase
MRKLAVDVAIIGAGSAGLSARRSALREGASVVLIDAGPLGTTCARVGCMPSKLLIAAADAAHTVREAALFGLETSLEVDGPAVLQRVQRERDRFVGFVLETIEEIKAAGELVSGRARFVDPHTLRVDDHTEVSAKSIVVATGSAPFVPPPFRGLADRLLTNDGVFELERLPESVIVVGAGVIGLELGQALNRLGTRVTVVDLADIVGPLQDPRCKRSALEALSDELEIFLGYQLHSVEGDAESVTLRFSDADGTSHERRAQLLLCAAGRRPQLSGLELERANIGYEGGPPPPVDPLTMQLGQSHIFLAGDVTGEAPLLHEASDEGHIAGRNAALHPEVLAGKRRCPLSIVFTEPQIAIVGKRFNQMSCDDHRVGEVDYGNQGRARVMNQNRGLVRIYGEVGSDLLVGAEMVGPRVENTAHLLSWAIQKRLTVGEALEMPFYHPVVEEGIRTALRQLQTNLRVARSPSSECEEFGPGT